MMTIMNNSLSTYENNVKLLREKIHHQRRYNLRILAIRFVLDCGIGLDFALPFIVSAFILGCKFYSDGNSPFFKDDIIDSPSVQTIDTSSGEHFEKKSYDSDYDDLAFEHFTEWRVNEEGLYERCITSYGTEGIDFSIPSKIFSMTSDEINDKFYINGIKTIKKAELDEEDKKYPKECFVITQFFEDDSEYIVRKENNKENFLHSALYLVIGLAGGEVINLGEKVILKTRIKDRLNERKKRYAYIKDENSAKYQEILRIREENLALLEEDSKVSEYKLRKK